MNKKVDIREVDEKIGRVLFINMTRIEIKLVTILVLILLKSKKYLSKDKKIAIIGFL